MSSYPYAFFRVFQCFQGGIQAKVQGNLVLKLMILFDLFHISYAFNTETVLTNHSTCRVNRHVICEARFKMLYFIFHK